MKALMWQDTIMQGTTELSILGTLKVSPTVGPAIKVYARGSVGFRLLPLETTEEKMASTSWEISIVSIVDSNDQTRCLCKR